MILAFYVYDLIKFKGHQMSFQNQADITKLMSQLASLNFKMSRVDGSYMVQPIRLLDGGEIHGHSNENEHSWKIDNGELFFCAKNGRVSTAFGKPFLENGKLTFVGDFVLVPEWKIKHKLTQVEHCYNSLEINQALTRIVLKDNIKEFNWEIGNHTYGTPLVMEAGLAGLEIGKFCSIAPGVNIILGNHITNTATTYPFSSLKDFWPGARRDPVSDHGSKGDVKIGNDVWIGRYATIMSGITIGDGAVIAANSVVTKDVKPYSIVGGNPAKLLRMRHSDEIVEALLQIKWWAWSDEEVDNNIKYLMSDINEFVARFKK